MKARCPHPGASTPRATSAGTIAMSATQQDEHGEPVAPRDHEPDAGGRRHEQGGEDHEAAQVVEPAGEGARGPGRQLPRHRLGGEDRGEHRPARGEGERGDGQGAGHGAARPAGPGGQRGARGEPQRPAQKGDHLHAPALRVGVLAHEVLGGRQPGHERLLEDDERHEDAEAAEGDAAQPGSGEAAHPARVGRRGRRRAAGSGAAARPARGGRRGDVQAVARALKRPERPAEGRAWTRPLPRSACPRSSPPSPTPST